MRFYHLTGTSEIDIWGEGVKGQRRKSDVIRMLPTRSECYYEKLNCKGFLFVSDENEDNASVEIGIIENGLKDLNAAIDGFLKHSGLELSGQVVEEVTFRTLRSMLGRANRYSYIVDDDEVLERFELSNLTGRWGNSVAFGENIIYDLEEKLVYEQAKTYLLEETALPELKRIYSVKNQRNAIGHPVQYMLETDDKTVRREGARLLLKALYAVGRIRNRRYCYVDVEPDETLAIPGLEALYKSSAEGTVIIRFPNVGVADKEYASSVVRNIEVIAEVMKRHRNRVLTLICLPRECTEIRRLFFENLANLSIIELKEEFATGERAKDFLRMLAKKNSIRADQRLFARLEEGKGYLVPELRTFFDEWYDRKLKTTIYPQYKDVETVRSEVANAAPKGSAYDELMELIGLTEAKKVIVNALNYYKAQKLFADKGMKSETHSMHMVFTGNPGSAKTTVARLFAEIMRDNHLLSKGHLVEVGRGDLVGQYVGWTAKIVKHKFKEAEGGVLFIDEAYSLVDDRGGSFGDEAINTIVQEMENRRDSVVVIFAGYPDKMEGFLEKNPGLRSRIAFHVPFADYNPDELVEIAELMSSKKDIVLSDDAKEKMHGLFETVSLQPDFGNGRFVRNLLEKARMAQATRLLSMDLDAVTETDVRTITADDIEIPEIERPVRKVFGFSAA